MPPNSKPNSTNCRTEPRAAYLLSETSGIFTLKAFLPHQGLFKCQVWYHWCMNAVFEPGFGLVL